MKRATPWSWLWVALGVIYFVVPLYATLDFSLRAKRGTLSVLAYQSIIANPRFLASFTFSLQMALLTIVVATLLMVPTIYWVNLRLPRWRPLIEFITLLPFVIPAIVHVFGLIRSYSRPPFLWVSSPALLVGAYVVLAFPYMYRAIDTGMRSIDIRSLTEAAQSLGAGWGTVLFQVIFPNVRLAILSGAFLTFAIVMGELTLALYLAWPGFGPFMYQIGQNRAYEPAALAVLSFALTWLAIGLLQLIGRGPRGQQVQLGGGR